jgi:hypothetical protein
MKRDDAKMDKWKETDFWISGAEGRVIRSDHDIYIEVYNECQG